MNWKSWFVRFDGDVVQEESTAQGEVWECPFDDWQRLVDLPNLKIDVYIDDPITSEDNQLWIAQKETP